ACVDLRRAAAPEDRLQPRRPPGRGNGGRRRGVAAGAQRRPRRARSTAAEVGSYLLPPCKGRGGLERGVLGVNSNRGHPLPTSPAFAGGGAKAGAFSRLFS